MCTPVDGRTPSSVATLRGDNGVHVPDGLLGKQTKRPFLKATVRPRLRRGARTVAFKNDEIDRIIKLYDLTYHISVTDSNLVYCNEKCIIDCNQKDVFTNYETSEPNLYPYYPYSKLSSVIIRATISR